MSSENRHVCPICGKEFKTERGLKLHMRYRHRQEPDNNQQQQQISQNTPFREVKEINYMGIPLRVGDTIKVIYGRYAYYIKITKLYANPNVISGIDVYGNNIMLRLNKISILVKLSEQDFYSIMLRKKEKKAKR